MTAYDILEKLLEEISDKQIWYFDDQDDAEHVLNGKLICGTIVDSTTYFCSSQPLENEICDAIFYDYGDYQFLYVIEE